MSLTYRMFLTQVVQKNARGHGVWVKYFSPHGNKWSLDEQEFLLGEREVVLTLPVPDMTFIGSRIMYVFQVKVFPTNNLCNNPR